MVKKSNKSNLVRQKAERLAEKIRRKQEMKAKDKWEKIKSKRISQRESSGMNLVSRLFMQDGIKVSPEGQVAYNGFNFQYEFADHLYTQIKISYECSLGKEEVSIDLKQTRYEGLKQFYEFASRADSLRRKEQELPSYIILS